MKIKKGDNVKIISGKDRGKTGKVLQFVKNDKKDDRIIVEGLNLRFKHLKAKSEREPGQRISFPASMNVANVMLVCSKCGKSSRVGYQKIEKSETTKEKKQRICKKCKAAF
jgi:large subunit ribosomal protein L24